jgi:tetratricopeptide (TPR) repeat protein
MGISAAVEESLYDNGLKCVPIDDLENYFKEQKLVSQPKFPLSAQLGLARTFGASHLLSGSYRVESGEITIEMSAYSLEREVAAIGSWKAGGKVQNLRQLADELSKNFVALMGKEFKVHSEINAEAFESYIRGRIVLDSTLKEVYFRKAVEIDKNYCNAQCMLALTLKEEGNATESLQILETLKDKSYARASLGLRALGERKMAAGKLSEAKELFVTSLGQVESAEGHLLLARLYFRQGKKEDALKELRIARSFGTHSEEIAKLQDEIEKSK